MADQIYTNLVVNVDKSAPESVHLCDYPQVNEALIDTQLEEDMELALSIVVEGRAARNTANIKNRQPIGNMYVKSEHTLPQMFVEIVADELNIKNVIFTQEVREFTTYKFKPQLRTLGPKYGKFVGKIGAKLNEYDGNELMDQFNAGTVSFEIEGTQVELVLDDVLVEAGQKEGFVAETDRGITVVIDTNLSAELIEEGFVREVISKIQTMRKEAGFEVQDHIKVYYKDNAVISGVMNRNNAEIKDEVLGEEVTEGSADGYSKQWNINGEEVTFTVVKL
jgi:isoleucyl-tRNA synthetase